jgi:hypothetical protein
MAFLASHFLHGSRDVKLESHPDQHSRSFSYLRENCKSCSAHALHAIPSSNLPDSCRLFDRFVVGKVCPCGVTLASSEEAFMTTVQEPEGHPGNLRKLLRIITGIALFCFAFLMIFGDSRGDMQQIGTAGTIMFGLLFLSLFVKRAI